MIFLYINMAYRKHGVNWLHEQEFLIINHLIKMSLNYLDIGKKGEKDNIVYIVLF